jgi:hypothetical protein
MQTDVLLWPDAEIEDFSAGLEGSLDAGDVIQLSGRKGQAEKNPKAAPSIDAGAASRLKQALLTLFEDVLSLPAVSLAITTQK